MAKISMGIGSLMAVTTCCVCCVLAVVGDQSQLQMPSDLMTEDSMYEMARGLKALGTDEEEDFDDVFETPVS